MAVRVIGRGALRVVATVPDTGAFGHIVTDVAHAIHAAREGGLPAVLIQPAGRGSPPLFALRSPDVRIVPLRGGAAAVARRVLGAVLWFEQVGVYARSLARAAAVIGRSSRPAKGHVASLRYRVAREIKAEQKRRRRPRTFGADYRLSYAERRVRVSLDLRAARRAERDAGRAGIPFDRPLVTLHVRDSAYKTVGDHVERAGDAERNASIDAYGAAINYLVGLGFTVVRIGAPPTQPVAADGLVDLANSPARTDLLELWCVLRSRFLISCNSGPSVLPWLTGVPSLVVNSTIPWVYPVGPDDRYILKHVVEPASGRRLSLREMASPAYFAQRAARQPFAFIDNTPDEIAAAVKEMVLLVDTPVDPTSEQVEFHRLLDEMCRDPAVQAKLLKGARFEYFLGRGRIGRAFAEGRLKSAVVAPQPTPKA